MSVESLEAQVNTLDAANESLRAHVAALTEERDAAIAALREALDQVKAGSRGETIRIIRAALAPKSENKREF